MQNLPTWRSTVFLIALCGCLGTFSLSFNVSIVALVFLWAATSLFINSKRNAAKPVDRTTFIITCFFVAAFPNILSIIAVEMRGGFDIALYGQMLHNTKELGYSYLSIAHGTNHMGYHLFLIMHPLAWIQSVVNDWILPYRFLQLTQLFSACLVPLALLFPREKVESKERHLLPFVTLLTLSFWGVTAAAKFEFHAETFGMYWSMIGIVLIIRNFKVLGLVAMSVSLLCGELFLVSTPALAIVSIFVQSHNENRKAVFSALLFACTTCGFGVLYYYVAHWGPAALGDDAGVAKMMRFEGFATSFTEILLMPFLDPGKFFGEIFRTRKVVWLANLSLLFCIPLIVALFTTMKNNRLKSILKFDTLFTAAGLLVAASGPLAKVLLSTSPSLTVRENHYVSDLAPTLFLALFILIKKIKLHENKSSIAKTFISPNLAVLSLLVAINFLPHQMNGSREFENLYNHNHHNPHKMRHFLLKLDRNKQIYFNDLSLSAVLSDRTNVLYNYSPARLFDPDNLPGLVILGWPPTHGYTEPEPNVFWRSFVKIDDDNFRSIYKGADKKYRVLRRFVVNEHRTVTVWEKR